MRAITTRRLTIALAVLSMGFIASEASAFCCGGGTTAFYPTTASTSATWQTASYPSTYQTFYAGSGWYPGYYWDRVRTRLWGSPTTYVAASPTTVVAAYPTTAYYSASVPSYSVSYAAAPAASCATCSSCQSCTAGYAPCSTCAPACDTCGVQEVVMRPVCTTACASPCTCTGGCSSCSPQVVTQTSYEQPACGCNGGASRVVEQSAPASQPTQSSPPPTFDQSRISTGSEAAQPEIDPNANVPAERREEQKPATNGAEVQPSPGGDTTEPTQTPEGEFYKKLQSSEPSTMLEPLKLHDPNDRTAWRSIAPVKNAVYRQPVAPRSVSLQRVTREQVRQDAVGWTSASK